jgi:hypothetical protein
MDTLAHSARIAVQEGHFRKTLDVEQFAYEVYCLVLGYFHTARLFRDPKATARVKAALARLVHDARVQH